MSSDTMHVRVVSFGPLKGLFPKEGRLWELNTGESVAGLIAQLLVAGQVNETVLHSAAIAVNHEYAKHDSLLKNGDEVAILPPVSGGLQGPVELVTEPIDSERIASQLRAGADGAVVLFDGIVRNNTRGRRTLHLDYEAYEEMALRQMRGLRDEAIAKFGVRDVALVHRLGRLTVGETSVFIAVASAHRGPAFDACRWLIDTLKKTVPIWKREQFEDGAVWADGEPFPEEVAGARP
jgi:molybdopterin synthase catalytic subunit/molybdopterin converting factor small subunit